MSNATLFEISCTGSIIFYNYLIILLPDNLMGSKFLSYNVLLFLGFYDTFLCKVDTFHKRVTQ